MYTYINTYNTFTHIHMYKISTYKIIYSYLHPSKQTYIISFINAPAYIYTHIRTYIIHKQYTETYIHTCIFTYTMHILTHI